MVWRTIILLKNTTVRERNQIKGERKNLEKLTEFDKWEKLEGKGKNWENWIKLEEWEELKKIDKIWNLDFVSLNHPGTC